MIPGDNTSSSGRSITCRSRRDSIVQTVLTLATLLSLSSPVLAQPRCETVLFDERFRLSSTFPGKWAIVFTRSTIELAPGDSLEYELGLEPENGGYIDIDVSIYKDSQTDLVFFDTINLDDTGPPNGQFLIEGSGLYFVESVARAAYGSAGLASISVVANHGCETESPIPANTFDQETELLNLKIATDDTNYSLSFTVDTEITPTIRGLAQSLEVLATRSDDFASFDDSTGRLLIPGIYIDGALAFRNVIFVLTDAEQLTLELESLE